MRGKTRRLTLTAVFSAFSVVFLYAAAVFPTGQLGFLGVCSLFGIAAVCEFGLAGGAFVFAVTALLGLFIVPDKLLVALYASFFGWYPLLKAEAEKLRSRVMEWAVKICAFNLAVRLDLAIFQYTLFDRVIEGWYVLAAHVLATAVFVLFDIGVSRIVAGYMARIFPRLHK